MIQLNMTFATALAHGLRRASPVTVDEHTFVFEDFGNMEYVEQIRMPVYFRHATNGQLYRVTIEPIEG